MTLTSVFKSNVAAGMRRTEMLPTPLDAWGRPLQLEVPGLHGQPYELVSLGADGLPGGRGVDADISNWDF